MMLVLSDEEEHAIHKANHEKLTPGKLFDLSSRRFFIAIEKLGERVEVIELNDENIKHIVRGEPCVRSMLEFDDMSCLNVRDQNRREWQ